MTLPLGHELVACTMHGAKIDGSRRVAFELLTQPQDVIVYGARTGIVFISPDFIKQLVAGNNAACVQFQPGLRRASRRYPGSARRHLVGQLCGL